MIRGTKNEGISSQSKERHGATGPLTTTGVRGEGIELIEAADGSKVERKDIDNRVAGESTLPSNAFNGTFE